MNEIEPVSKTVQHKETGLTDNVENISQKERKNKVCLKFLQNVSK
jgi:hypothetical protein